MKKLIFAVSLFLSSFADAATLSGRVTDPSGKPLADVQVAIPALQQGAKTDESGAYKIENVPNGRYAVEYRPVDYPKATRQADLTQGDAAVDVAVTGSPTALVPITISAAPTPQSTLTTPASVSVVEGRELEKKSGQSVMAAIQNEPGVAAIEEGPTVVKPIIRGLSSQDLVIAEDGVRAEFIQWGNEHAPEIASMGADRIEVLRGASSLMYGSDALGGVISVNHAELPSAKLGDGALSGKINMETNSVNRSLAQGAMLQGARGDWGWRTNVSQQQAGNYSAGNQGFIPNTGEHETNGNGAIGVRKDWGSLTAEYGHFYKYVELQNGNVFPALQTDTEYQTLYHDHAKLKGDILTGLARLELIGGYDRSNRVEYNGTASANGVPNGNINDVGAHWIETSYTADVKAHLNPMGPFQGTLGFSGVRRVEQQLTPDTHLTPGYNENGTGEYLYEEVPLGKFTFNFGVRGDQDHYSVGGDPLVGAGQAVPAAPVAAQNLNYSAVSGAAGAVYHVTEPLAFAFNVGRGYRNPVPFELFADGVHEGAGVFQIGNPNLKPENSLDTDASIRWASERLKGEIGVFRNYIHNYIYGTFSGAAGLGGCPTGQAPDDTGTCIPVVNETQANATIQGVDYTISAAATDWLTLTSGGGLVRGYNDSGDPTLPNIWIPHVPADNIRAGAEIHRKRLGSLSNPYFGLEEKITNAQRRASPNELQTPGYALLSARVGTEFVVMSNRVSVDAGVNNLLDKSYIDYNSITKNANLQNPGRNVYFKVAVPFGG